MEMKRSAPAKVNLALDILGRREDGYDEMRPRLLKATTDYDKLRPAK